MRHIFFVNLFILSIVSCTNSTTPLPPPTLPSPKTTSSTNSRIVYSGTMNIEEEGTYREILAQSGICGNTSWSTGLYIGTSSCSNLKGDPLIQLVVNQNKTRVQELYIYPEYERNFFSIGGSSFTPIVLQPVNSEIYPINDSEGWEVRFYSRSEIPLGFGTIPNNFSSRFEIRLRCEYCDLDDNEFEDIDVYRGIYSDGARFGTISDIQEVTEN